MSKFSVHKTADIIQPLRYCLVLDGERIAGGKPDYRGNNCIMTWQTDGTYGPIDDIKAENEKLRILLKGWQKYAVDNTFGDIYRSEDVVDSYVVTFCDKHGYRLYTSMEVYELLHDPHANEQILTHDELPETIPCSDVFADIDV